MIDEIAYFVADNYLVILGVIWITVILVGMKVLGAFGG